MLIVVLFYMPEEIHYVYISFTSCMERKIYTSSLAEVMLTDWIGLALPLLLIVLICGLVASFLYDPPLDRF